MSNEIIKGLIEVKDGRLSAKELYLGLGMDKTNWKRWSKTNIENNEFFKESIDWIGFVIMTNGNKSKDYNITLDFAKHLAMMSKTKKAHEYRNYFIECEKFIQDSKLTEEFKYYRETGKIVRRDFTNTIKNVIKPSNHFVYSNYTNLVYQLAFGKTAKQMKLEHNLRAKQNLRDYLSSDELEAVLKAEEKVKSLIIALEMMGKDNKEIYQEIKKIISNNCH